jgi:hypothetical protein
MAPSFDRRESCRYASQAAVMIRSADLRSRVRSQVAELIDVSQSGALLKSIDPFPDGSVVLLSFSLDGPASIGGHVIRCAADKPFGFLIAVRLLEDWPYSLFTQLAFPEKKLRETTGVDPFSDYFR